MLVSVVIPVYNVEKYLNRCLKSVSEQTFKQLEIILIDDGSTDNSGAICEEFASHDLRAKVVHKLNGGLSSARNVGTDLATGDFVTYLDSDDFLAKDYVEKSIKLCNKYNADISILDMLYINEYENDEHKDHIKITEKVLTPEKAIEESLYQILFSCCAPSKMYRTKIAKKVKFPENKLSEDLATCHLFLSKANKVIFSNQIGYYYRQRDNSIMHVFNPKRLDALKWVNSIEKYCLRCYPRIINAAYCRTFNVAIHLALDLPDDGLERKKYFSIIWSEIKRTRIRTIVNIKSRNREKAAAILSFGGEKILKTVWNSRFAVKRV